ncbi:MAG: VanZ family protein [Clostridia bacterium]|nr:VanZ family protein [Clostridia bacterium]
MKKLWKHITNRITADGIILFSAFLLLLLFFVSEIRNLLHPSPFRYAVLLRLALLLTVCLLFFLGGSLHAKRTNGQAVTSKLVYLYFALYLYLLINVTLLDPSLGRSSTIYGSGEGHRQYYMKWFVNLVPLRSIREVYINGFIKGYVNGYYTLLNLLGNICAFMPLSFFLPLFFPKQKRWYLFFPTLLGAVLAIELLQLAFMVGSCDIDDVILNVAGGFLAFWLLKIPPIRRLCKYLVGR